MGDIIQTMSKQDFVKCIEAVEKDVIFARNFNVLVHENGGEAALALDTPRAMVELLAKIFGDDDGYIGMWCFEFDFGRLCGPEYVFEDDGEYASLPESAEGLYDFLTE